jgi:membrane-bound acyltransferase YfiQ involved in biofilm formation
MKGYQEGMSKIRKGMMSFLIYLIGFMVIIAGVAWALIMAGVAFLKIAIVCLIILGLGIVSGVVKTRPRDPQK